MALEAPPPFGSTFDRHAVAAPHSPTRGLPKKFTSHPQEFWGTAASRKCGLKVERADAPGDLGEYTPPVVILNAVQGLFETDYPETDIPDLLFSPAVSDSFATFHVSCWKTKWAI